MSHIIMIKLYIWIVCFDVWFWSLKNISFPQTNKSCLNMSKCSMLNYSISKIFSHKWPQFSNNANDKNKNTVFLFVLIQLNVLLLFKIPLFAVLTFLCIDPFLLQICFSFNSSWPCYWCLRLDSLLYVLYENTILNCCRVTLTLIWDTNNNTHSCKHKLCN